MCVADRSIASGAQVCVMTRGQRVLDVAVGDTGTGRPMAVDTVGNVYCAIKPITAVAVAGQIDTGRLRLDEPLSELLPAVRCLREQPITLRHVLNHTAGLHEPYAVHMELLSNDKRTAFVDRMRLPEGWKVGRDAGYSEFAGWHLLGRLLEVVTGEPLRDHLRSSVLDPLGMADTWIGMTEPEYQANAERIGLNQDLRGWAPFPLLHEQLQRVCCEINVAYGGYTTARDMAAFYAGLLEQLDGGERADLPSGATLSQFCSSSRARSYDVVLKRHCEHGLGFMTGLRDHHFGEGCSPQAFGHSGWSGTSFGFADPACDVAAGVVLNGIADSTKAFANRSELVAAMYADLGGR